MGHKNINMKIIRNRERFLDGFTVYMTNNKGITTCTDLGETKITLLVGDGSFIQFFQKNLGRRKLFFAVCIFNMP